MPNFNRDALKKGGAAIREANEQRERGSGREFKPFLSNIYWGDDGDEHYLLFLNSIDEIPRLQFHPYIDLDDGMPHMAIARTDDCIGDRHDPIEDKWDYAPRLTNVAIVAELEPTFEEVDGRKRPTGFEVKTRTFDRRIRDDDGKLTEEKEEVTAPCVAFVAQSPYNFGNQLESYDATEAPIHKTALKIKRVGKDSPTYQIVGYPNGEVDLTNLLEYIEFVSYIKDPDEIIEKIDGLDDFDAATEIGNYLLDLKLDELADPEEYDALLSKITKPSRFAKKDKKGDDKKASRAAKPSQRRSRRSETEESSEPVAESAPEAKEAKPTARRRKADEDTSQPASAKERLAELRAKSGAKE